MDIKQLGTLVALVECGFNVTETAERLFVVQSAVSQQLSRLEKELGTQLIIRKGKRLVDLTEAGHAVLQYAQRLLVLRDSIHAVCEDQSHPQQGLLRIGATHAQARYILPLLVRRFRERYPQIGLQIQQGTPADLVEMALTGKVDLSICTEQLVDHPDLNALRCYRWNRCLVAPPGHPVFKRKPLSLEAICEYPLITYSFGFTGAGHIGSILSRAGLNPDIVLTAVDSDVIKTYVRENLGIGIIAQMAYSAEEDTDLKALPLDQLLPWETTWVAYSRDKFLRRHELYFIDLVTEKVLDNGKPRLD